MLWKEALKAMQLISSMWVWLLLLQLPLAVAEGKAVRPGDWVLVEVYDDDESFIGYLQSCKDHIIEDSPHVCASKKLQQAVRIGLEQSNSDPNAGFVSFMIQDDIYACPCNHPGTITFVQGDDHAISQDHQAAWELRESLSNEGLHPVLYNKLYSRVTNKRWSKDLGCQADDPPCNHGDEKVCLNLDNGNFVGFKLLPIPLESCMPKASQSGWWDPIDYSSDLKAFTVCNGVESENSQKTTKKWAHQIVGAISLGFKFGKVEVKAGTAQSIVHEHVKTFVHSKDQCVTTKFQRPGQVWQWTFNVTDTCGNNKVSTNTLVETPSLVAKPCCLPGYAADPTNQNGDCLPDASGKVYSLCEDTRSIWPRFGFWAAGCCVIAGIVLRLRTPARDADFVRLEA